MFTKPFVTVTKKESRRYPLCLNLHVEYLWPRRADEATNDDDINPLKKLNRNKYRLLVRIVASLILECIIFVLSNYTIQSLEYLIAIVAHKQSESSTHQKEK